MEIVNCLVRTMLMTKEKLTYFKMGGSILSESSTTVIGSLQNNPKYSYFKSLYYGEERNNVCVWE